MHNNNVNNNNNVSFIWAHIESPSTCSHEVGTINNRYIMYADNTKQFLYNVLTRTYSYMGKEFKIVDEVFKSNFTNFIIPDRTKINTYERLILSLGLPLRESDVNATIDMQSVDFKETLHTLTLLAMKDLGFLPNYMNLKKQLKYGSVIFDVYIAVVSGSGRLNSKSKNIRWLNEQDTLQLKSKFFTLSDEKKYKVNAYSMMYKPNENMENVFKTTFELLKAIDFVNNDIELEALDFVVSIELLKDIRVRDIMLLLSNCIGYNNGFIIRPKIKDEQKSRVYSIFTSIGSTTRKHIGFTNYDIGSALQTICLQLVKEPSLYPLHQELVAKKNLFRQKIAYETAQDLAWVKTELSKIDNLDNEPKRYANYPILQAYFKESLPMRKEIVDNAEDNLLQVAQQHAKHNLKKSWDILKNKYIFVSDGSVKESSLFFFIWTQWERQIRHAMMDSFSMPNACHQVHDAVYSTEDIEPSVIEAKVLDTTGFKVTISKE